MNKCKCGGALKYEYGDDGMGNCGTVITCTVCNYSKTEPDLYKQFDEDIAKIITDNIWDYL